MSHRQRMLEPNRMPQCLHFVREGKSRVQVVLAMKMHAYAKALKFATTANHTCMQAVRLQCRACLHRDL